MLGREEGRERESSGCDFDRLALKEETMDKYRAERMRQGLVQSDDLIGTKAE